MNRKAYSKLYNEFKQGEREAMRDAMKRFQEENLQRFAELQAQAIRELNEPTPPRIVTRYPTRLRPNLDEFIRRNHVQDYFIYTKDTFGDEHTYFEELNNETPEEVLTRRHTKFTERREEVIKIEKCTCPLCISLN